MSKQLYRNPKKDWVKMRLPLYFLLSNQSFATVPGLEREVRKRIDIALIRRVAEQSAQGCLLAVNTTDVDDGSLRIWDVGAEADRALKNEDVTRIQNILLASAGIPAAFPFREIDGSLFVDDGVTGNILYGGGTREDKSLLALWANAYPNLSLPTVRY